MLKKSQSPGHPPLSLACLHRWRRKGSSILFHKSEPSLEFVFSSDRYGSTAPACSIRFFLSHHGSFLGYTVGALILASSRYTVKHLNTHTHGHEGVSPFIYLFYSTDRAHTVHAIHTFFSLERSRYSYYPSTAAA